MQASRGTLKKVLFACLSPSCTATHPTARVLRCGRQISADGLMVNGEHLPMGAEAIALLKDEATSA
jgi:hypothetical protein